MEPSKKRNIARKNKTNSKIVDRLTYNPLKHKKTATKTIRAKLQLMTEKNKTIPSPKIKFGSFNVNGLDIEAAWPWNNS